MSSSLKRLPKHVNLNKLKKEIDLRIAAILKYLEDDSNFINASSNHVTNSMVIKSDKQSTTINRDSIDIAHQFISSKQLLVRQSMNLDEPKLDPTYNQFQQRTSLDLDQVKATESISQLVINHSRHTPIKASEPQAIGGQSSNQSSVQSASKRKIQASAEIKIFGVPLTETDTNVQNEAAIQPFSIIQLTIDKNSCQKDQSKNKNDTSRSKKQKNNKENCTTPYRSKLKQQRRTPFSNNFSAVKKLFQYFSGFDRVSKIVPQQMIQNMKQQLAKVSKQIRKQANQNNARVRLLKRISQMKINKTDQLIVVK